MTRSSLPRRGPSPAVARAAALGLLPPVIGVVNGRPVRAIAGGAEGDDSGGGDGDGGGGDGNAPPRTFSQSDLDAIVQREKAAVSRTATKKLAEELGLADVDALKALVAAAKQQSDAQKSEAQKAKDAADERERKAGEREAVAQKQIHEGRVERALLRAQVKDTSAARALRIVLPDVDTDATDEQVKAAVDALKRDEPGMFGAAGSTVSTDPGGRGRGGNQVGKDPRARAQEIAERRGYKSKQTAS